MGYLILPWGLNFYWKRVSIVPSMSLVDVIVMLVIFLVHTTMFNMISMAIPTSYIVKTNT